MPRGRPKKDSTIINTKNNQSIENDVDMQKQINSYLDYVQSYSENIVSKLFSSGIITTVKTDEVKKWLSDPIQYNKKLSDLMHFYYGSNGDIFQLYDLVNILPTLNYKIDCLDKANKTYEKNMLVCNKTLKKIKHKGLTRSILTQEVSTGTVVCIWLGDKKSPYLYIFDNIDLAYPAYKVNGEWVCVFDFGEFANLTIKERKVFFDNFKGMITEQQYLDYQKNSMREEYRYIELPIDRTCALQTHTLTNKQALGMPWGTQSIFDLLHKQTLKNLETAIANKIINSLAILTIGSKDNPEKYGSLALTKPIKDSVANGVKNVFDKNVYGGLSCIVIPEFASMEFPEIKNKEALSQDKFETVNNDISSANGVSGALTNGNTTGSYANSKISLDMFYKRIDVLLEGIEEIYNKLFNLILPNSAIDMYYMCYEKGTPLTSKERLDILQKLHVQEGFALKPLIDDLSDIDWASYIKQSIYEQEEMKLPERIKPYASSFTGGDTGDVGANKKNTDDMTESGIKTADNGGNEGAY